MRRKRCRHCRRRWANKPKGLCWTCYHATGVRDRYPSTSKFARRGVPDFDGPAPPPREPTDAKPATEGKVKVLIERMAAGVDLWHPQDATWGGGNLS